MTLSLGKGVRGLLGVLALLTWGATAHVWSQSPLAAPFVAKSDAEIRVAIDRAMTRQATPDWLATELSVAIRESDSDRMAILLRIADSRSLPVDAMQRAEAEAALAADGGVVACARCAWDTGQCRDIPQIMRCSVPVELTPLGDLNALRRQGSAYLAGENVDRVDLGLATVGLGATAAVLASGGTSLTLKAGTAGLRIARRSGLMTARLGGEIADLARASVRWDRLGDAARGRHSIDDLIVAAPAARLGGIARDVGRLRSNTGTADALALVSKAESSDDLAGLARLSDALGPATRSSVATLGTARILRLTVRLGELALAAIGLLALILAQIGGLCLWALRRSVRRRAGQQDGASP